MPSRALLLAVIFLFSPQVFAQEPPLPYRDLNGRVIRKISLDLGPIFEGNDLGVVYDTANNLKVSTKEYVVLREMLLKEGQEFDESKLEESERNIRALRYLRDVRIERIPDPKDPRFIDLVIHARDTWSIIPQFGYSTGSGRTKLTAGLIEHNLLGYGKKIGALYAEDEKQQSVQGLWEDYRLFGTKANLSTGYFDRNDGEVSFFNLEQPFRSLSEEDAWGINSSQGDTIGRLFQNGEESYIFRQKNIAVSSRYTIARGDREREVHRLAFGYDYIKDNFKQADSKDYEDLDLNPAEVSNDPADLAENRLFSGPSLYYRFIEPQYVSKNYIDRFDRLEDFNLGAEYSVNSILAADFLGSYRDTYLFSANCSEGMQFSSDDMLRAEAGYASRFDHSGSANTLYRAEAKYYNVLGPKFIGGRFIGKHTLAFSWLADYGEDLDKDRQLSLGGDNGLRGYQLRTFNGDKRMVLNFEDRVHIVDDAFKLLSIGAAAFVEGGGATYDGFGDIIGNQFYSDAGVGLRIAFPRSIGSQILRIDLAIPLRDGPDGSAQFEPRLLLTGGQVFSSRLRSETLGAEKASVDVGFDR